MENISTEKELSMYSLDRKWNDYIGVQKEVLRVLKSENFFEDSDVINKMTGMHIKINPKGIKETIGAGNRYQSLPKKLKIYKIATIRYLKQIIRDAELLMDNVENIHERNGYAFAYFYNQVCIDEKIICVRISVMKRVESNWFWIHNIDEKEKSSKLLDLSKRTELKEI